MLLPPNARCPAHEDLDAITVCQRCGTFMCEVCADYGVDVRCAQCRPKRGKAEIAERRTNAVRKAFDVRCLGCDYRGPRYDLHQPVKWYVALLLPFGFGLGVLPGLFILRGVLAPTHPCVGCGKTGTLVPLAPPTEPYEESFLLWTSRQPASNRVHARNQAIVAGAVVVLVVVAFLLISLH